MAPPPPGPLRVAIVGAGPAGLYTAASLLTHFRSRLPSSGAAAAAPAAAATARVLAVPAVPAPLADSVAAAGAPTGAAATASTKRVPRHPPPPSAAPPLAIDIYEAAAVPFGLIRSGVAPDHGSVKRVAATLDEAVLRHPAVRLFANTPVSAGGGGGGGSTDRDEGGRRADSGSVPLTALQAAYHAVVVAAGGGRGVVPPLPGAHLRGVMPALDYVGWLNGHPPATATVAATATGAAAAAAAAAAAVETLPPGGLFPDAPVASAVVIGAGNVALDVARSLVTAPAGLAAVTDAAAGAVGVLAAWEAAAAALVSRRRTVTLVARRGPAQAAWTPKELRELLGGISPVEGGGRWAVSVEPDAVALDAIDAAAVAKARPSRRCIEALQAAAAASVAPRGVDGGGSADKDGSDGDGGGASSAGATREVRFRFCLRPEAFLPSPTDGSRVGAVRFARVALSGPAGRRTGTPTGETLTLPADLVVTATGYAGCPLTGGPGGLPRDPATGGVAHVGGRVVAVSAGGFDGGGVDAAPNAGLYVAGWAKRGPTGIIATNKWDAEETAAAVVADWTAGRLVRPAATAAAAGATADVDAGVNAVSAADRDVPGDPAAGALATAAANGRQVVDAAGWARIDAAERAAGAAAGKAGGVREKVVSLPALLALARGEPAGAAGEHAAAAAVDRRRGG